MEIKMETMIIISLLVLVLVIMVYSTYALNRMRKNLKQAKKRYYEKSAQNRAINYELNNLQLDYRKLVKMNTQTIVNFENSQIIILKMSNEIHKLQQPKLKLDGYVVDCEIMKHEEFTTEELLDLKFFNKDEYKRLRKNAVGRLSKATK